MTAYRIEGKGAWRDATPYTPAQIDEDVSVASAWSGAKDLL